MCVLLLRDGTIVPGPAGDQAREDAALSAHGRIAAAGHLVQRRAEAENSDAGVGFVPAHRAKQRERGWDSHQCWVLKVQNLGDSGFLTIGEIR